MPSFNPQDMTNLPVSPGAHLTRREREILSLLAQDLSNGEIADRLVVSPGTVKWYVKEIYAKLGVHSRDEAIAAVEAYLSSPAAEPEQPDTPHNLPGRLTTLIGRKREIADIRRLLLRSDVRLLSLVGTPGIGKTRLSIETAYGLLNEFPDGVYFVALAPIQSPALVADAMIQAFGLQELDQSNVVETLKSYLRDKRALIICDNFEHLLKAAALVSALLAAAPNLKVLTTSREPLRLYGEHEYAVPPLALPGDAAPEESDAINLFIQRARAVKPDFAPTSEQLVAVGQICLRLDGLPLAIELAAARIKFYTPQVLLARLDSRLTLLTTGARDLPQRHQTLRNAIDWSYQLLDDDEKRLFRWLGIFLGGWTLEALEAVCTQALSQDVFHTFELLLSKSLVKPMEGSFYEPRWMLLETIREFALEQLEASQEMEQALGAHAAYFLSMADTAFHLLAMPEAEAQYDLLESEMDNLRAALAYYHQREDGVEREFRMIVGLAHFWYSRSHVQDGLAYVHAAMERDNEAVATNLRAWAHFALAILYDGMFQATTALKAHETALALARKSGDKLLQVLVLRTMCGYYTDALSAPRVQQLAEEALTLVEQIDNPYIRVSVLLNYRIALMGMGEYERGQALMDETIHLARELKLHRSMAYAMQNNATWLNTIGDYEGALSATLEGLEAVEQINHPRIVVGLLCQKQEAELGLGRIQDAAATADQIMETAQFTKVPADIHTAYLAFALVAQAQHDFTAAKQALRMAFQHGESVDDDETKLITLMHAGSIFTQNGNHATACRVYGAVDSLCREKNLNRDLYFLASVLPQVAATRAALGEDEHRRLEAEGAVLSIKAAWAFVLTTLDD